MPIANLIRNFLVEGMKPQPVAAFLMDPSTGLAVAPGGGGGGASGSTGKSYGVGQNIPTGQTLLATIPVNAARLSAWVENQSGSDLTMVGDVGDGSELWTRILTPQGAGKQGADWTSPFFRGRIRVYGPASSQVSVGEF